MKKALFISFYWPPSGKASMHWPLKMVKFLPEFGWESSVLTVKKDTFSDPDLSMLDEVDSNLKVYRTDFWDPFILYKKWQGKKKDETLIASEALSKTDLSFKQKLSIWIRMNFFIPDARMGWYWPGISQAKKMLKNEKFDAIVSNGPPHTTHLISKKLSKMFNVPLVSVFIDPWVDISYYKGQKRSKLTLKIDNFLERSVMQSSDQIVVVTDGLVKYFGDKYPFIKEKTNLLYWGYNEDDFVKLEEVKNAKEEVLLHAGNIFDHQNPANLWPTLKKEINKGRNLKIRFIGTVSPLIKSELKKHGLESHTDYKGFLPYSEVLQEMQNATFLLVCATEPRHVPGKLFEYMRTGNFILAFGDDNMEVSSILKRTNTGQLMGYQDNAESFFNNLKSFTPKLEEIKKFDRYSIAHELAKILDRL